MTPVHLAHPDACEELRCMFVDACNRPTSIHQHLSVMRDTASGFKHITELGVGEGWSTLAWLLVQPDKLVLVDHGWQEIIPKLQAVRGRTKIVFIESDDLMIRLEPTDLLFIDTEHHYGHLKEELRLFAAQVRSYIILHDTTTFANVGEAPHLAGLWPAVEEFLAEHPEWRVMNRFTHNNGLTILGRNKLTPPSPLSKTFSPEDYARLADEVERVIEAKRVFAGLHRFDHEHRLWEYAICLAALGSRSSMKGKMILDVGGGSSLLSGLLAREGAYVTVMDVGDHSSQTAQIAAAAGNPIHFIWADVTHCPNPEDVYGLFDAVLCISTIEHTDLYEQFLDRMLRIVRPGGVFVLTTDFHPSGAPQIGGHNRTYNAEMLNRFAQSQGFVCENGTDYRDRGGPVFGYNFASLVMRRTA